MGRAELRQFHKMQARKQSLSKDRRIKSLAAHIAELQRDGVLKKPSKIKTLVQRFKSYIRSKVP